MSRSPSKFPFLLSLIVSPSLTPFGIITYYFAILFWTPPPLQLGQNYLILVPYPPQELQVVCMTNMPCLIVWAPVPLHVLHLVGFVPGLHLFPLQVSHFTVLLYSTDYRYKMCYFRGSKYTLVKIYRHVHYTRLIDSFVCALPRTSSEHLV